MNLDDQMAYGLFGGFFILLGVAQGLSTFARVRRSVETTGTVTELVTVPARKGRKVYHAKAVVEPSPDIALDRPVELWTDNRREQIYREGDRIDVLLDLKTRSAIAKDNRTILWPPLGMCGFGLLVVVVAVL